MDRAVNEHEQWSWFYWELEVGCCYWYFDLCAVAYLVLLEVDC